MRVRIAKELPISEIATEQAKLPHVISDIFADIAYGAIGANDNFLVFLLNLCVLGALRGFRSCSTRPPHNPAAFVLPGVLESKHAGFLKFAKRRIPKMKMEYLALAGQKVIFNVEP